jgi:L-iditol 2-dehydrogenase
MRAVVYRGPGILRVEKVEVPAPGPGEILVRVDVCGVCGTDIKKIQKGLLPGPRIFGHEIAGTVVEIGAGVSRLGPGERVALHHHIPCGDCFYCRLEAYAQCAAYKRNGTTAGFEPSGGGYAEYVKAMDWIVARGVVRIPDGVSPEEAAFVEPVNTCLKCVQKTGVRSGDDVLVIGQGPIGLLLTQLARWAGGRVIASDTLPDRLEVSRRLGAEVVLDASVADVAAEVRGLTSGRGVDRTFVAALGAAPIREAVAATRPAGRIMVFSATSPGETAEVDFGALCLAEKDILTSYSASVDLQDTAAQLVFSREIRVRELVTHRYRMDQALAAFDTASHPEPGVLKVVLQPCE